MKAGTSEGGFQLLVYPTLAKYAKEVDFEIDNFIKSRKIGVFMPFFMSYV